MKPITSGFVKRPSLPEPCILFGSTSCSANNRRTAGPVATVSEFLVSFTSTAGFIAAIDLSASAGFGSDADALADSSIFASNCPDVTTAPTSHAISLNIPSAGAGTSSTTLSVSKSSIFSPRDTASPAFLCHAAMVASETDSGNAGTFTSIDIVVSYFKRGINFFRFPTLHSLMTLVVQYALLHSLQRVLQRIPDLHIINVGRHANIL